MFCEEVTRSLMMRYTNFNHFENTEIKLIKIKFIF